MCLWKWVTTTAMVGYGREITALNLNTWKLQLQQRSWLREAYSETEGSQSEIDKSVEEGSHIFRGRFNITL